MPVLLEHHGVIIPKLTWCPAIMSWEDILEAQITAQKSPRKNFTFPLVLPLVFGVLHMNTLIPGSQLSNLMDNNRLRQLLAQYFDNTINREDCEVLLRYLDEARDPLLISSLIDEILEKKASDIPFKPLQREQVYGRLMTDIHHRQAVSAMTTSRPKITRFGRWIRVAALLVMTVSVSLLIYRYAASPSVEHVELTSDESNQDILLPDGNQAILTLTDGRTIIVNDSVGGVLALESGVEIRHTEEGSIVYDVKSATLTSGEIPYNTFSTPKGHSYQLSLPDGTRVWLNTGSSLRFPVAFAGDERKVTLTGEAYFEVSHDAGKPFEVQANGSTIQVLGTHFNVSAYTDDKRVTTTLVEGAVNVSKNGETVALKPGQQAVVHDGTGQISQSSADIRSVLAWKNGYFRFDDETIESIISKISRWYDIGEVEYQGQFNDRFTGTFQRSKGVSQLFGHLEKLAPVRFEIKERRIVVMR